MTWGLVLGVKAHHEYECGFRVMSAAAVVQLVTEDSKTDSEYEAEMMKVSRRPVAELSSLTRSA